MATFERTKPHINIGTIGHVDHGKTTFSAAITRVASKMGLSEAVSFEKIDNAPEEKARGITIKASTIEFNTEKYHYSLTDCPGHKDYIKNMITGASQADVLILLIAATDGAMQQTEEHVLLAKQINVPNLFVFINKTDELDAVEDGDAMLELVEAEALELVEKHGFKNVKVFYGSALGALEGKPKYEEGIQKLLEALDGIVLPPREVDKPFLMPVEGVHVIQGRGTVATGKIEQGVIKTGETVEIVSRKKEIMKTTVTGVQMFRKDLAQGQAGDNLGLLLRGVAKKDISRGDILAAPGTVTPHTKFKAEVYILSEREGGRKKAFQAKYRPQFYMRTADVTGTINNIYAKSGSSLEEKEIAMPGDNVVLEVTLIDKVGIEVGLRFTIREGGRTIGAGVISEIIA